MDLQTEAESIYTEHSSQGSVTIRANCTILRNIYLSEIIYFSNFDRIAIKTDAMLMATSGPGCSKQTTSLVNVSLKFQTLISEKCQNFLLKKCEKLVQKLLSFFQQKISLYSVIKS